MRTNFERSIRTGGLAAVLAVAAAGLARPAGAQVLYATGFEAPSFTPGPISGQDGWGVFGASLAAQIENTFARTGTQAVAVIPALAAGQTGPFRALSTAAPRLVQSGDIFLASSSVQTAWQFAGLGPGLIGFAGGIDVDATGAIHAITAGFPIIGTFARDSWNHIDLLLDFSTQQYSVVLNGTTIASNTPFCGSNAGCTGAVVAAYGSGFFDTFAGTAGQNDIGYLDNYVVAVASVPEPTTVLMLASGLFVVAAVRRRRSRERM